MIIRFRRVAPHLPRINAMGLPISPDAASDAATQLFYHHRDHVAALLSAGPSMTFAAGSELTQ